MARGDEVAGGQGVAEPVAGRRGLAEGGLHKISRRSHRTDGIAQEPEDRALVAVARVMRSETRRLCEMELERQAPRTLGRKVWDGVVKRPVILGAVMLAISGLLLGLLGAVVVNGRSVLPRTSSNLPPTRIFSYSSAVSPSKLKVSLLSPASSSASDIRSSSRVALVWMFVTRPAFSA